MQGLADGNTLNELKIENFPKTGQLIVYQVVHQNTNSHRLSGVTVTGFFGVARPVKSQRVSGTVQETGKT